MKDDPNRPETEEDGIRAEKLRRLRVRQLYEGRLDPARDSSRLPSDTSGSEGANLDVRQNMPKVQRDPKKVAKERGLFKGLASVKQFPMDEMQSSGSPMISNGTDLPPRDLIDLVARRHKISREKAKQLIDESGMY
ncbi:MAG: hypothetical protein ACQEXO_08815 [Pseudomonadota bacterium]